MCVNTGNVESKNKNISDDFINIVMIQSLWRGKSVRKNIKVFNGVGELPNFMKTDTWRLFKSSWKKKGKIPIYRLSEYWRKIRHPTDEEKRETYMNTIMKYYIDKKRNQKYNKLKKQQKQQQHQQIWKTYRKMIETKTKKDFNNLRKEICRHYVFKIKGVSKLSRREIEMETARQFWR